MMELDSANIIQDADDVSDTKKDPVDSCRGETVEVERKKVEVEEEGIDVNMEACISADDVMRAGGFGARDDISSFLPVASDSTDFEASLRDARDYEEPQKDISRPGLGWKDVKD